MGLLDRPHAQSGGGGVNAQVMAALDLANETRMARAALRDRIAGMRHGEGRREVASIIRDPDPHEWGIKARYLIRSIHRVGAAKEEALARRAGLSHGRLARSLSELTERERNAIAGVLEDDSLHFRDTSGFTNDELALIRLVCVQLAERTKGPKRDELWTIAEKAGAVR